MSAQIEQRQEAPAVKKAPGKKGPAKKIILAVVALAVVAAGVFALLPASQSQAADDPTAYTQYTVSSRDITVSLSGSGTLKPADSYTVTSLVSGEILSDTFDEGDTVEKDDLLYQVDSSDLSASIQKAENSLSQSQRSYEQKYKTLENLSITAPQSGTVIELSVEVGDKVNAGQTVAVIRDVDTLQLTLPFVSDDAVGFYAGQSAQVTIDGTFEQVSGTVSKVSAVDELVGSLPVRQVTIDIQNPGGLALSRTASAVVGSAACSGSGSFEYKAEAQATAETSGEVAAVSVAEGGKVRKGDLLVRLTSDSLNNEVENAANSLSDARISLDNQYDQLDNYQITSPISGTIIEKHYKAGDNLENNKTLCVIFDLSYLTMTLNVDELDISKVSEGQSVTITAEAVEGETYTGTVTKVNINGTTSGGVTTYPVTVRIDQTDGLLPGMNVSAEIVVLNRESVLAVPVAAVSRGNRVLVSTDGVSSAASGDGQQSQGDDATRPTGGEGMTRPEGFDESQLPEGFDPDQLPSRPSGQQNQSDSQSTGTSGQTVTAGASGLPDGFEYVTVTLGESDGSYIEITGGLSAGDIIAYIPNQTTGSTEVEGGFEFGFGGGGQMPSGGGQMPSGGAMPSGGGRQ